MKSVNLLILVNLFYVSLIIRPANEPRKEGKDFPPDRSQF